LAVTGKGRGIRRVVVAGAAVGVLLVGTAPPSAASDAFGTQPVVVSHEPAVPSTTITSVGTGIHDGYDRVVITTAGLVSNYAVKFVSTPVNSPKGDRAAVPGSAFVTVTVSPVTWTQPLPFPAHIDVNGPELLAVVRTEQFEGYVTLTLGLHSRTAFRVFTLSGPDRLVVDVAHESPAPSGASEVLPATGTNAGFAAGLGLVLVALGALLCRPLRADRAARRAH
jgi:LPXTG-motif cell wall-anchored protein